MRDVFAPEAQHHAGHGRIPNFGKFGKIQRRPRRHPEFPKLVGRAGVYHRVITGLARRVRPPPIHGPTRLGLGQPGDGGVEAETGTEVAGQGVRQHLQPFVKGKFGGAILCDFAGPPAFARAEDLAFDHRTVFFLEGGQFGKRLLQ